MQERLEKWAEENADKICPIYDKLEPFDITNDRMAELLLPLQSVLMVAGGGRPLEVLREYASALDQKDREEEMQSPGVRLLAACREIFIGRKVPFLPTANLIIALVKRKEEPWHRWNHGRPITDETLARLLRPYGIRPARNKEQTARGYYQADFKESWERYLPQTAKIPSGPPNPSIPARQGVHVRQDRRVFRGNAQRR